MAKIFPLISKSQFYWYKLQMLFEFILHWFPPGNSQWFLEIRLYFGENEKTLKD